MPRFLATLSIAFHADDLQAARWEARRLVVAVRKSRTNRRGSLPPDERFIVASVKRLRASP